MSKIYINKYSINTVHWFVLTPTRGVTGGLGLAKPDQLTVSWANDFLTLHELMSSFIAASSCFSSSSVRGPAQLPAAAGHAVVRRLPRLEETTLGRQTGHLPCHRPPVSRLLTGETDGTAQVDSAATISHYLLNF